MTISWNRQPANGSPSARNASGPMSRSALVTIRWSNTKLPLSEPATTRSQGSQWRRSGSARISSSDSSRASGGTHTGTHSHSASKWQSSVSVSRRAGPPQRGQVVSHELLALGQRVAGAGRGMSSGSSTGSCSRGTGTVPQLLAVDDRDRRAPRALAGDREVVGAVAHRGRRRECPSARGGASRRRPAGVARGRSASRELDAEPPRDHLVGAVARGTPSTTVGPKRASTSGEIEHRQRATRRGRATTRRCRSRGSSSASRALRSQPPERSCSSCSCTAGSAAHASTSGWRGRHQHEARLAERVGVRREDASAVAPSGPRRSSSTPSTRPSTIRWEASATSSQLPLASSSARRRSFSWHVGADPQVPLRQLDQPDGPVAAPAGAARLDLDRGERGLAVVAPVDVPGAPVDQPGLEQREEQPLRPAVHDRVGAEERALPVEGEAQSLQLPGHVRGAAATHSLGGSPPAIAPSSAGRPKASKPKANSTASPRARRKRA